MAWRDAARELLAAQVPPHDVQWSDGEVQRSLFDSAAAPAAVAAPVIKVPKDFIELARKVVAHSNPDRFSRLYTVLWRLQREPQVLQNPADIDLIAIASMAKNVSRDCHKMKAFVRFRDVAGDAVRRRFMAWFEPQYRIVELTGPFFARRFADMDWVISTPHGIAMFVGGHLSYAAADGRRPEKDDATEDLWRTYYSNIFNPARLKVKAMTSEMPKKYWKNLPEAQVIPELIAGAAMRAEAMRDKLPTVPMLPIERFKAKVVEQNIPNATEFESLADLRAAAMLCTRCPLHCHATQTVCGEGQDTAQVMFVGEQPGDQEDIQGRAFVGPAGRIFDDALDAAGIDRADTYVTNAVKHFKFSTRGKRRIHERPNRSEITACRWWVEKELHLVKPKLVVAMGATALMSLTGQAAGISTLRGQLLPLDDGHWLLPTFHPSAILRNADRAEELRRQFFADIARVPKLLRELGA